MRTRIALAVSTAAVVVPAVLFAAVSTTPSAAAGASTAARHRHQAGSRRPTTRVDMNLAGYSSSRRARAADGSDAASEQKEAAYLKEVAFMKEEAFFSAVAAANSVNAIPAAWMPTALCEEGGRDDPRAGYFGILAWDGFDGYPTAGSAPLAVQLAWEAAHGQGPPDAAGECHSY